MAVRLEVRLFSVPLPSWQVCREPAKAGTPNKIHRHTKNQFRVLNLKMTTLSIGQF
jgi:hypothetical protein